MEMGIPGQFDHAEIERAYERVIAACRRHGKAPGMGGVYTEELLAKYVDLGMRMILSGNDLSLIIAGGSQKAKFLRSRG
jgi:4-hydroxy-2-oxoheptanedioate aldolase